MDTKTIDSFLESIGLGKITDLFRKNQITLDDLVEMYDEDLKYTLKQLELPLGPEMKIITKIKQMKEAKKSGNVDKDHMEVRCEQKPESEIRLVLLGKTGCGKSATGNSILGLEKLKSRRSCSSVTSTCFQASVVRNNRKILVVDTPGIFDTKETNEVVQKEIYRCIGLTAPGPHAFIFVLSLAERFTNEEEQAINQFVKQFGENIYRYLILLFTRKNELTKMNQTLDDCLDDCPENFKLFIAKCGKKVIAFENDLKGTDQDDQVEELLQAVLKNVAENGGKHYTNEMYMEATEQLKKVEEEKIEKEKEKEKKHFDEIKKKIIEEQKQKEHMLSNVNSELDTLTQAQKNKSDEASNLKETVEGFEKRLTESNEGDQKELKRTIDELRKKLTLFEEDLSEKSHQIENLRDAKEKGEKEIQEQKKIFEKTREKYYQRINHLEKEGMKEDIIKELNEGQFSFTNVLTSVGSTILSWFRK